MRALTVHKDLMISQPRCDDMSGQCLDGRLLLETDVASSVASSEKLNPSLSIFSFSIIRHNLPMHDPPMDPIDVLKVLGNMVPVTILLLPCFPRAS